MSTMMFWLLLLLNLVPACFAVRRITPNPSRFSDDRCIEYVSGDGTWNDANDYCKSKGTYLANIHSEAGNWILLEFLKTDSIQTEEYFDHHDGVWIGLTDVAEEGNWQWTPSDVGNQFFNWAPNQPEQNVKVANSEDCALMESDGKWHDYPCDSKHGWVCMYTNFNGCPPGHDHP